MIQRSVSGVFVILLLALLAGPAGAADLSPASGVILRSSNPDQFINQISAGEMGELRVNVTNLEEDWAYGVAVGFYNLTDGEQLGDTVLADLAPYGNELVASGFVWSTWGLGGAAKQLGVQLYHSGDVNPNNNATSNWFQVRSPGAQGNIAGRIISRAGVPLAGEYVWARNFQTMTTLSSNPADSTGAFTISGLNEGHYFVYYSGDSYVATWLTGMPVYPEQTTALTLVVDTDVQDSGALQLSVYTESGDTINHSVFVFSTTLDPESNERRWITIGNLGTSFPPGLLTNLPGGLQVFLKLNQPQEFTGSGMRDLSTEMIGPVTIIANTTLILDDLITYRAGSLEGTVLDRTTGAPLANVEISIALLAGNSENPLLRSSDLTDNSGNYSFDHLRPGIYMVKFEGKGSPYARSVAADVVVAAGETTRRNLMLDPGAEVYGRISNIGQFLQLTGFYPGPSRELGVVAAHQFTADSYADLRNRIGKNAIEEMILAGVTGQVDLQTGDFSFGYTFPSSGTYDLAPFLYWENADEAFTVATFGSQAVASPGAGNATGPVTLELNTSIGRLTGTVTPDTLPAGEVVIWVIPVAEDNPLAGFACAGRNRVSGAITYDIPFIPVGAYTVYAACPGQDTLAVSNITILQGATRTLNLNFTRDTVSPGTPGQPSSGAVALTVPSDFSPALTVTWTAPADNDLAGYNLYRSLGGGAYRYLAFAPAGATSYADDDIDTPALAYTWRVTALDQAGNESPLGSANTWTFTTFADTPTLLAPAGYANLTQSSSSQIYFSWTDVVGADSFTVTVREWDGDLVAAVDVGDTTGWFFTGTLPDNSPCRWVVTGRNLAGDSGSAAATEYFTWTPVYTGAVWGWVTNQLDSPLAGVTVNLMTRTNGSSPVTTSDTGFVLFPGLADGYYYLTARDYAGYGNAASEWLTLAGDSTGVQVKLAAAVGSITGWVCDNQGQPLSGINVNASRQALTAADGNWLTVGSATTDSSGYFSLNNLSTADSYSISIWQPSSGGIAYSNVWEPGHQPGEVLWYQLQPAVTVSGLVSDSATGAPLAGISIYFNADAYDQTATSDTNGFYSLSLIPGNYKIDLQPAAGSGYGRRFLLNQRIGLGINTLNLQVPPAGAISGTVDTGGAAFISTLVVGAFPAGTVISLTSILDKNLDPISIAEPGALGAYTLDNLPDGAYDLYCFLVYENKSEGGFGEDTFTFTGQAYPAPGVSVARGQTTTGVNFTVAPAGYWVSGALLSGGLPLTTGADQLGVVTLNDSAGNIWGISVFENLVPGSGRNYSLERVPAGSYTLFAYVDGFDTVSQALTVSADTVVDLELAADQTPPDTPAWWAAPLVPAFSGNHEITLQWYGNSDVERYEIYRRGPGDTELLLLTGDARPEAAYPGSETVTYTDYTSDTIGVFRYALRGYDLSGNVSGTSAVQAIELIGKSFTDGDTAVSPVEYTTASLTTTAPTFQWLDVAGATSYRLYLATSQQLLTAFTNLTDTRVAYPANSDTMPKLYPGRTYWWSVEARAGSDTLSRTAWRGFQIADNLTPPRIVHDPLYAAAYNLGIPVEAYVYAPGGVSSVQLHYGNAAGYATFDFSFDTTAPGRYIATLPAAALTAEKNGFFYRIVAYSDGGSAQVPAGDPTQWDITQTYYVPLANTVQVDGFLYETGTTTPIPDAQVWVRSQAGQTEFVHITTDQQGHFGCALDAGDSYFLFAQGHGYQPTMTEFMFGAAGEGYAAEVDLSAGRTLPEPGSIVCYLEAVPAYATDSGLVTGLVVDGYGNPVPGALVALDRPDTPDELNPDFGVSITNPAGWYTIPNVCAPDTPMGLFGAILDPVTDQPQMFGFRAAAGDPGIFDSFTVGAGVNLMPILILSAGNADNQPPSVLGIVDSGSNWVTVAVSEALSASVSERANYALGETRPLAASDTPVEISHVLWQPASGDYRITLQTQWTMSYGATYQLQLGGGLRDWAGNAIAPTILYFTLESAADLTPPRLLSAVVLEGDTTGADLAVFFSEAMSGSVLNMLVWGLDQGADVYDTGSASFIQPDAVVFRVSPLIEGQLYTFSCSNPAVPQDLANNPLAGETEVQFYGRSSGVARELHLVALAAASGQPEVAYGQYVLIANDLDSHATVRSLRDPAGFTVELTPCRGDRLPEIVYQEPTGGGGWYAALVRVDSATVAADTVLAAWGGDLLTIATVEPIAGGMEALTIGVGDTWTGYRNAVITGTVGAGDTAALIVKLPDYEGEAHLPPGGGVIGADRTFSIEVDENAIAELTATRLSDLNTITIYGIHCVPGETVSVGALVFPATTDTFGIITGLLDIPETGPSLIRYSPQGERLGWADLYVHPAGSSARVGKPINPDADLIQLPNGDLKYTLWGIPVAIADTTTYIIEVSAEGYLPQSRSVELTPARKDKTNVNFELKLAGNGAIRGRVVNLADVPVRNLELFASLGQSGEQAERSAVTNDLGFFEFGHLPAGTYTVACEPADEGYVAENRRLLLDTGATVIVNFRLVTGATIRGEVLAAADSAPLSGATVEAVPLLGGFEGEVLRTFTSAEGKFTLAGVPLVNGLTYRVSAARSGYAPLTLNGIEPGDTDVAFALATAGAAVTGRVGSSDTWLEGVSVRLFSQQAANLTFAAQSNSSGTFTLTSIPAGYYSIEVVKPGYRRGMRQNVAVADSVTTILPEFILENGAGISGRVTNAGGFAIPNATVRAVSPDSLAFSGSGITNASGNYSIVGLVKNANYRLVVIQNQGAGNSPYSRLIFLTGDQTINIEVLDYGPQFLVNCQRSADDSTSFTLTLTASEALNGPPLLTNLWASGAGSFNTADSRAVPLQGLTYQVVFTEPDSTATVEQFLITGTDLQGNAGSCTYTFYPLYEQNQEVLLDGSAARQYSLGNGASVIIPEGAFENDDDTSGDAARSSVRLRISQVDLQNSTGGSGAPRYYGAPGYLARYAPPSSGSNSYSRSSNDYDIHLATGAGDTISVAPGRYLTITLPYDDTYAAAAAAGKLHLYYYNETLGRWMGEVTSQTIDLVNRTITISVSHLSKFAAFKDPDLAGDLTGNSAVDNQDLQQYNGNYTGYQSDPVGGYTAGADISGPDGVPDGVIDFYDTSRLGEQYGQ